MLLAPVAYDVDIYAHHYVFGVILWLCADSGSDHLSRNFTPKYHRVKSNFWQLENPGGNVKNMVFQLKASLKVNSDVPSTPHFQLRTVQAQNLEKADGHREYMPFSPYFSSKTYSVENSWKIFIFLLKV